jgi:hypothetical protein
MRVSSWFFSLLAISCVLGCSDDGSATTNSTTDGSSDTAGDGDGDPGDGDGDGGDAAVCVHHCTSDADCLIQGMDVDLTCIDSVCSDGDPPGCADDQECVALYSGWAIECTSGGSECDASAQVCIDVGGEGLCATAPNDIVDCASLLMEEIQTVDIDGNPIVVCAQPNAVCSDEAFCYLPCQSDDDCFSAAFPNCEVDTGMCRCGSDADCATTGQPHFSVCSAGACGCSEDQQCIDGNAGDICTTDGFCGCSGDMACANLPNSLDGGMFTCDAP